MIVQEKLDEAPPPKYESLWERAILQLDEKSRSIVEEFKINGCKPEQLLADVHSEVEKCKKKQWHIYTTNKGRRIFIRDLFKRITGFLDKVTSIGDAVAQYDPIHLSLPWALARFLLIAAVSDINSFGAMLESMEMVTDVVARYAVIENIFLRPGSEFYPEIEKAITSLYVAVLTYICKAKCYFRRNTLARISISILEVEKDCTKFMQQISDEEDKVEKWVQTGNTNHIFDVYTRTKFMSEDLARLKISSDEGSMKLQAVLLEMEKPVSRMADQLENMQCSLEKDERAKIIKWISNLGTDFEKNHRSISNNRLKNSGHWLINTRKFRKWINCSACSVLWLYGGAGYGKSFLVSLVVDLMLQERTKNPETAHLAYFYCTRDTADPKRAQPVEILRSIVRQLSCQTSRLPIRKPVLDKWYDRVEADSDAQLDVKECVDVLLELTRDNPAIICIDALDECDVATRRQLLKAIGKLVKRSQQIVKVFVSSRREGDFLDYFEKWESLQISATDNREDIINFVDEELKKSLANRTLLHGDAPPELIKDIKETLLGRADGMFRWVSASLQSLCDPLNTVEEDVREALRMLPKELEEVYGIICEQIERRPMASRKMAENTVRWLLCGNQPLSCEEMIKAILPDSRTPTASITKEQILSICCNFVKIDDEVGIFRFVHLSVREYLEKRPDYELTLNHSTVAASCLKVCSTNVKPKRRGNLNNPSNKTFYDYAQVYWPVHCQNSKQYRRKEPLETLFRAFLCGGKWATKEFADWNTRWNDSWIQMELDTRTGSEGGLYKQLSETRGNYGFANPIYVACAFGFTEVIEDRRQVGMGERDSKARNSEGRDLYGIAVRYGQKEIVNLLRATTILDSLAAKESALLAAVSLGELEMVTMLLKENPDLVITAEVVEAAASNCDVNMMKFLLEEYLEFTVTEQLLLVAAENEAHGHEVIPFLFEQSVEDIEELDNSNLLQRACSNSRRGFEILQYILDNSERINITEEVVLAAALNKTDAYQMLKSLFKLDKTIQVTEEMVVAAARNSYVEPIRLLLSHAPELTITWQITTAAVRNKDCGDEILLLLLDKSKESFNIDEDILLAAVTNLKRAVMILDMLLPRCDRIYITNEVLQAAAKNQFLGDQLIILILKHVPGMRLTALDIETAASSPYYAPEILRELINFDQQVPITTDALEEAAMNHECGAEALELLLNYRSRQDTDNTPTMHSSVYPSLDAVRPFNIPPSVVEVAASNADSGIEVMELLLRYCSDLRVTPRAIENAAANPQYGEEIIALWQKHNKKLDISAQAIQKAALNQNLGLQVMKLLFRCDKKTPISDDAMQAAAANPYHGVAMVKLMLPRWKSSDGWEQVFSGASRNAPMGVPIMKHLIAQRRPAISSDIIESCAWSSFVDADQIITLLNAAPGTALGPETVESASFYSYHFFDILAALREHDPNVPITDAAVYNVIRMSYNVIETIEMLRKYRAALTITEGLLKAIVQNVSVNESTILFLCDYQKLHCSNAGVLPVTNEIIATALQNSGTGAVSLIKILLKLAPGSWDADENQKRLQIAAGSYKPHLMIDILVDHAKERGHVLPITTKVFIKAARNQMTRTSPLKTLLRLLPPSQQDIVLDPEVLTAAIKNRYTGNFCLKMLITYARERNLDLQVSDSIFNIAVKGSYETVKLILQGKTKLGSMVTETAFEEAATTIYEKARSEASTFHWLLKTLSQEGITIPITSKMFEAALKTGTRFSSRVISYFRRICRIQGLEFSDLVTSQSIIGLSRFDYRKTFAKLLSSLSESKRKELLTDNVVLGVAGNGSLEALDYLLSLTPYPFSQPPSYYLGISALQRANWTVCLGNERPLLKSGVFPNAVMSRTERTLLSFSAAFNEIGSVRAFLMHGKGVDVNHRCDDGKTPLHYACENGHVAVVELLLRAGADREIQDNDGMTAADAAVEKGNLMIERLVRGWGKVEEEGGRGEVGVR
jgi:hypothetical protein